MKKSWKKASAIFMAAALAAGLAGCGASNNNNTATTAAGKSAAESKVNGENSPEADNKKTDVTVRLCCKHQPHRYVCGSGQRLL